MVSKLVWQAQSRDDLVIYNIVNQIMKTTGAKQHLMNDYFEDGEWKSILFNQFLSHLLALYDISRPMIGMVEKESTLKGIFDAKIGAGKRVRPSLKLYGCIIQELKEAGIWNVSKKAHIKDVERGRGSVYGL